MAAEIQWSTRAILATYELVNYLFGVRVFRVGPASVKEATLLLSDDFVAVFYEVAVFPEGSWWLPTSTVADKAWDGSTGLQATGAIPSVNVLRPRDLFIWIPRQELGPVFEPITLPGVVEGDLPTAPPPAWKALP